MAIWTLSLLFAGAAVAHMGVKTIVIDGVMYVSDNYQTLLLISFQLLPVRWQNRSLSRTGETD
jgi:hypothetical protein